MLLLLVVPLQSLILRCMNQSVHIHSKSKVVATDESGTSATISFFIFWLICLLFIVSGGFRSGTLLGNTSWLSLSIGGVNSEVDVLFRDRSDIERWNIDELGSNTDVTLADQDTGVVDGLGKALLVDLSLKAAFQQLLGGQLKDSIQLKLVILKKTESVHATKKGSSLENSLGILGV